jgi:hypothetical protein
MLGRKENLDHFLTTLKAKPRQQPPKMRVAMTKDQKIEFIRNHNLD